MRLPVIKLPLPLLKHILLCLEGELHTELADGRRSNVYPVAGLQDVSNALDRIVWMTSDDVLAQVDRLQMTDAVVLMSLDYRLVASIEKRLGSDGRVLVRYSGTEPKVRVMIEGPDQATITGQAREIADAVVRACGAG